MNENNERDQQLDRLLDSALAQYGAAEPLYGMEERVLGRLRDGGAQDASRRGWWMWGGVAAAALATVVVAVMLLAPAAPRKPTQSNAQQNPQASAQQQKIPQQIVSQPSAPAPKAPKQETVAARPRLLEVPKHPVTEVAANGLPKRAVFPTPMPPNEQEMLLARYVRVTPRAEVMAQANRKPLEFREDPLSAPSTGGDTSPHKAEGTK